MQCYACGEKLEPVFGPDLQDDRQDPAQCIDALQLCFTGGYGMFIDVATSYEVEKLRPVICKTCAVDLCDKVPWIRKLLSAWR